MYVNQSQLWDFSLVSQIRKNLDLVQNKFTRQLMVRRISPAADYPVLQTLCRIKHRNLMEIYDVKTQDGVCISLCEYINGMTLDMRIEYYQPFDIRSAKQILCQICDGLSQLHINGIVHRDIKPGNVMITDDGTVKIIDYSISRLIKPEQRKDTTVLGTAGYASPEQFGFTQTNGKTDIYACGVLLNYLLTGKLPNEQLHQGLLTTVIQQCIEIDENKRFASADELKKVLQGKKINRRRPFRPLPGFRSKHVFPKIITVFFYTVWIFMLFVYINGFSMIMSSSLKNIIQQLILMADIMVFWSALPYLLFGDVFRMSERINPDNPRNGKYVLRILGTASIILGFVLIFVSLYL
ncbi:serine/threonine protein kinase [Ruminococcus sp.]|uniref:serine/threonine protein kinase n=1 Tax=Ruminococcus sp. TaxID=41978 RepID=UPI002E78E43F|nr:serine/threonine-protein kinase [Ruminococcus sp.]MEE1261617.1 serine/threonine-protein kinase [Ruminococcus sp.]